MERITEAEVLEKYGVQNFGQMTKSAVEDVISNWQYLTPEARESLIENFPQISGNIKGILTDYEKTLDSWKMSNDESMNQYMTRANQ